MATRNGLILRQWIFLCVAAGGSVFASGVLAHQVPDAAVPAPDAVRASADLNGGAGSAAGGIANFEATPGGVLIRFDLHGLTPGEHAIHIHAVGRCDADDGFKSAGGHFAADRSHGYRMADGPHPGDLPNIVADDDGKARGELFNGAIALSAVAPGGILDQDGAALIVHEGADDYRSQPSGAAGGRVLCGEVAATP